MIIIAESLFKNVEHQRPKGIPRVSIIFFFREEAFPGIVPKINTRLSVAAIGGKEKILLFIMSVFFRKNEISCLKSGYYCTITSTNGDK